MAFYIAWIFIHFSILLINGSEIYHSDEFFPIADISKYDLSEFLIYTLFPIVFIVIIRLIKGDRESKSRTKEYETKISKIILDGEGKLSKERVLYFLNEIPVNVFSDKAWAHIAYLSKEYSVQSSEIKREDNKNKFEMYFRKKTLLGRTFGNPFVRFLFVGLLGYLIILKSDQIGVGVSVISMLILFGLYFLGSFIYED